MSIQIFPTPRTARELFELFVLYDRAIGIPSLTRRLNLEGMDRPSIIRLVMGREPSRDFPPEQRFNPRELLANQLKSAEFMKRARVLLADAYAEKKRFIFVHVPKCAGSDVTRNLRERFPALPQNFFAAHRPDHIEAMFGVIRDFVIGTHYSDTIALTGHERLSWYQSQNLVRPGDKLFTTVREPTGMVYSNISYMLTVCELAREKPRDDATAWLRVIGLTQLADQISPEYLHEVGRRLLHARDTTPPNRICLMLGDGTAEGTLQRLAKSDIEITDTARYTAWRSEHFPGNPERRINVSKPYFQPDATSAEDRDFIEEITKEDRIVYERIAKVLDRKGTLSIKGRDLA